MKNIFKKNQIVITALAIMIAVAGYLNYSGTKLDTKDLAKKTDENALAGDVADISDEDILAENKTDGSEDAVPTDGEAIPDIGSLDMDLSSQTPGAEGTDTANAEPDTPVADAGTGSVDTADGSKGAGTPGEAVLANSSSTVKYAAQAKVMREQVRAKNKETLLGIINNKNISDEQKQDAINRMVEMTDIAEREAATEVLLEAKGFADVVVNITDDTADIVVNMSEVNDAGRAQIEDIVKRKTGISAENIVITPVNAAD